MDARRNAPCPCGSSFKYKKCCGSLLHPKTITVSSASVMSFNSGNIVLLPTFLKECLGSDFIYEKVENYDTTGMKSLEVKKYTKRFHPLYSYWRALKQCIKESIQSGKLKLNEQSIFLIDLFFKLRQAKQVPRIEDVIERIKDPNKFLSSCFELEVINHYLDLKMRVEVVEEVSSEKTPDLLVFTKDSQVFVEAKLLECPKVKERDHLEILLDRAEKVIQKAKKSLNVNIEAHKTLYQKEHNTIIEALKEICDSSKDHNTVRSKCNSATIHSQKICDWDDDIYDILPIQDTSDFQRWHFGCKVLPDGRSLFKHPYSVAVTQHDRLDITRALKSNLENAKSKETHGYPYVVHIGLPHNKPSQIMNVTDSVYENLENRVSKKVNAVIVQASSPTSDREAKHPVQTQVFAIPNFEATTKLPTDFKITPMSTLVDWSFPILGEMSMGYEPASLSKLASYSFIGTLLWMSSEDAQIQIRMTISTTYIVRLEVICPEWGRVLFSYDINSDLFSQGKNFRIVWNEESVTTMIDAVKIETTLLPKRLSSYSRISELPK